MNSPTAFETREKVDLWPASSPGHEQSMTCDHISPQGTLIAAAKGSSGEQDGRSKGKPGFKGANDFHKTRKFTRPDMGEHNSNLNTREAEAGGLGV